MRIIRFTVQETVTTWRVVEVEAESLELAEELAIDEDLDKSDNITIERDI